MSFDEEEDTGEKSLLSFEPDSEKIPLNLVVPDETAYLKRFSTPSFPSLPPDPVSLTSSFIHGASLGYLGEEPNTGLGQIADLTGMLANFIVISKGAGLAMKGTGLVRGTTVGQELLFEGLSTFPADVAFVTSPAADDLENPEALLPLFTAANLATVPLSRLWSLGKSKLTTPVFQEGEGRMLTEVLDEASESIRAEAEGVSFENLLRKEASKEKPVGTPMEENIVRLNRLGEDYRILEEQDLSRWERDSKETVFGFARTEESAITAGEKASRETIEDFLVTRMGRELTQEEQVSLMGAFLNRPANLVTERTFSNVAFDMWERGEIDLAASGVSRSSRWSRKIFPEEVDDLFRRLDDIEAATSVGLPPTATYDEIIKRTRDVQKGLSKLSDNILNNPVRREILDQAIAETEKLFENRKFGVSPDFAKTDELLKMISTNAVFSRTDDLVFKTDEINRLIRNLERNQAGYERRLKESTKKALQRDFNSERDAGAIVSILSGKKDLDPQSYSKMRVPLARYIIGEFDSLVTPNLIDEDIGRQIAGIRKQLGELPTKIKDEPELKSASRKLREQEAQAKTQLTQSLFSNQGTARALAMQTGNENLVKAVDFYFASLGDIPSQAYVSGRQILGNRSIALDMQLNQIKNRPTPSARANIDVEGRPTSKKTLVDHPGDLDDPGLRPPSIDEQLDVIGTGKELGTVSRLFGTPQVIAERYERMATTEVMKNLYGKTKDFFGKAYTRYNLVIEDQGIFETQFLKPFEDYVAALGEKGSMVSGLVDELSTTANKLLKEGISDDDIYAIGQKKISAHSREIQDGYDLFRKMDDWIADKGDEGVRRYNRLVELGEIDGEKLALIKRRPYHVHFRYEGDFILFKTRADGERSFLGYVKGRQMAVDAIKEYQSKHPGDMTGRFVMLPKIIDDAGDLVRLGSLARDMDRTMGVDAAHLKTLIDNKEFTKDTLYDVFYGARKDRLLGLEEKRIDTLRATALSAIASIRFSNYIDLVAEGQQLAKTLGENSLPRWRDYVKTFSNDLIGISRNLEQTVDDYLQGALEYFTERIPWTRDTLETIGITPSSRITRSVSSTLTFLGRVGALGFNVGTAFINMMILPTNVFPVVGMENLIYGMRNLGRHWNTPEFQTLLKKGGVTLRQSGILFRDELTKPDILLGRGAKAYRKIDNLSMWMFNKTEDLARGTTMLAAYKQAEKLSKSLTKGVDHGTWQEKLLKDIARGRKQQVTNREVLDEYAVHVMKNTNFDFSPTGLSELARNPVTKPWFQFKTFLTKEIEFLMGQSLPLTHKERFLALGMFGTIGGLFALPGVEDIDTVSRYLFGVSPKLYMDTYLPEIATAGLPAIAGIDLSNRISLGSVSHLTDFETFPFGLGIARVGRMAKGIKEGRMDLGGALWYSMSSLESMRQGFELLSTGELKDRYGQTLATREEMSPLALVGRVFGFQSTIEGDISMLKTAYKAHEERVSSRQRRAMRDVLDLETKGRYSEAREIQKKAGITDKQKRSARKKQNISRRDLLKQSMRTSTRSESLYREALENIPEQ